MNAPRSRRTGRPRLDAGERERLLAQIAKLDSAPLGKEPQTTALLRSALTDDLPGVSQAEEPQPPKATPAPSPELTATASAPQPAAAPEQQPKPELKTEPKMEPAVAVSPGPKPAPDPASSAQHARDTAANWSALPILSVEPALLDRNLVITARRSDPAHGAFDVLRTRLVQALAENGWKRVAITSPTAGCGKSFTAINLAVTLSRYDQCRTVLLDMDMRRPGLAGYLGLRNAGSTGDFLRGHTPASNFLTRLTASKTNIGSNLALGLNSRVESYAAELFQQRSTAEALAAMEDALQPEVVLLDLPPALAQDDVIACRPHFDCILMIVGGGITTAEEVREATRRLGEDKPVLGVVLNKAEVEGNYAY